MNKIAANYSYIITYVGIVFVIITLSDHKYLNQSKALILIPAGIIGFIGPLAKILFEFILHTSKNQMIVKNNKTQIIKTL